MSIFRLKSHKKGGVLSRFCVVPPGLHHDPVPAALLEGREAVLPQHQQPQHDVRRPAGEEDLGPGHVLCALQALLHPRHHHRERDAAGAARRGGALQPQVSRPHPPSGPSTCGAAVFVYLTLGQKGKSFVLAKKVIGSIAGSWLFGLE